MTCLLEAQRGSLGEVARGVATYLSAHLEEAVGDSLVPSFVASHQSFHHGVRLLNVLCFPLTLAFVFVVGLKEQFEFELSE